MRECFQRLANYWLNHGAKAARRVANAQDIAEWEKRYQVRLSNDLRDYVLTLNGIESGESLEMDSDGFSFLPLSAMQTDSEWGKRESSKDLFVIADVLVQCYWYCVRLDHTTRPTAEVFLCGGERPLHLTDSLEEFFELYMMDSPRLHPQNSERERHAV